MAQAQEGVSAEFRARWCDLYRAQGRELRAITATQGNIFERAVFVFQNRERLSEARAFPLKKAVPLIFSHDKLATKVASIHHKERIQLARQQSLRLKPIVKAIEDNCDRKLAEMATCHHAELARSDVAHAQEKMQITPVRALEHMHQEALAAIDRPQYAPPRHQGQQQPVEVFAKAAEGPSPTPVENLARIEEIKRQMEEFRRRRPDWDHGREM